MLQGAGFPLRLTLAPGPRLWCSDGFSGASRFMARFLVGTGVGFRLIPGCGRLDFRFWVVGFARIELASSG